MRANLFLFMACPQISPKNAPLIIQKSFKDKLFIVGRNIEKYSCFKGLPQTSCRQTPLA